MNFLAKAAAAALTVWGCSTAFALTEPATQGTDISALAGQSPSADALYAEHWIRSERDNHGRPFAIVDKKAARIFVFAGDGRLVGASPSLLGATRGDVPVPGSDRKAPSQLLPNEQRTPAGRFHSIPGRNNFGEDVVWVDYDSSIAIHRVRPGASCPSRSSRASCCRRWVIRRARSTCCRRKARCRPCSRRWRRRPPWPPRRTCVRPRRRPSRPPRR